MSYDLNEGDLVKSSHWLKCLVADVRVMSRSEPNRDSAQAENGGGKRAAVRRRVLKAGIVAFNNRQSTLHCAVRDISARGARLRVEGCSISVPDTFELIIELDGLEVSCEVLWRKGMDVGIRFLSTPQKVPIKRVQIVAPPGPAQPVSLRRKPRPGESSA